MLWLSFIRTKPGAVARLETILRYYDKIEEKGIVKVLRTGNNNNNDLVLIAEVWGLSLLQWKFFKKFWKDRCMCGPCQQVLFLYWCIMLNFTWFSTTLPTENDQSLTILLNLAVKLIGPTSPGPLYLQSLVSQLRFMLIFLMSELYHLKPISMYSLVMS